MRTQIKFYLFLVILTASLSACWEKPENRTPKPPVLEPEKMKVLMRDIHLAESRSYLWQVKDSLRLIKLRDEYNKVFAIHDIDSAVFDTSFKWYMANPAVFEPMYEEIISLIKDEELYAPEDAPYLTKPDSMAEKTLKLEDVEGLKPKTNDNK